MMASRDGEMRTIFKYEFTIDDDFRLDLPADATIVHVAAIPTSKARAHLWAEVETDAPVEHRRFHVRGTGHPIPEDARHLATWLAPPYVWHLFEPAPDSNPKP